MYIKPDSYFARARAQNQNQFEFGDFYTRRDYGADSINFFNEPGFMLTLKAP